MRIFQKRHEPTISLLDYLQRIVRHIRLLEPTVFLAISVYVRRLKVRGYLPGPKSIHRIVIASVCLGSKAIGDHYYSNAFYARIGGVSTREMDDLEMALAFGLDWNLQCSRADLEDAWNTILLNNKSLR